MSILAGLIGIAAAGHLANEFQEAAEREREEQIKSSSSGSNWWDDLSDEEKEAEMEARKNCW